MRILYNRLASALSLPIAAGIIGSFYTARSIGDWYPALVKPALTPPGWVFGPVWTLLYIMMGLALYRIWRRKPDTDVRSATSLFLMQLVLNVLWSILFFGLRSPLAGLVGIAFLWLILALTIRSFYRLDRKAGLLLLPYIAWVSFALYLNLGIVLLN